MRFAGVATTRAICRQTIMITPDFMLYHAALGIRKDLSDFLLPIVKFSKQTTLRKKVMAFGIKFNQQDMLIVQRM